MNILSRKRGTERKRKPKAALVAVPAFVFIAVLMIVPVIRGNAGEPDKTSAVVTPVRAVVPERGDLSRVLKLNGYVLSDDIVTVVPFVSGTLKEIVPRLGDKVEKGQIIARIDSRVYDLQLKQAEAAYLGVKSSFERVEQLFNSGAATRQTYDQTRSQYDAYKSQYELAKIQVSYTEIEAPISGTVIAVHANEGSIAAPELPVLTIGDLDKLVVKLNIPDKYYELFRSSGNRIKIEITRPSQPDIVHRASVSSISPVINAETKNFEVVCNIDSGAAMLRPGMFVYCSFTIDSRRNVYFLPFRVIGPGRMLWYVDAGDSTAQSMEYSEIFSNEEFFVVEDRFAGYQFIIEGQSFLQSGQKVRIK